MALVEYTWMQFQRLGHIQSLPLHEQARQYQFHLDTLSNERMKQSKGDGPYLLQESDFYLLQENGNKIRL